MQAAETEARIYDAARLGRRLFETLDLSAVRLAGADQYVAGPGAEAAIVRIKGTSTSVAMSLDGNGRYCALDPREGTKLLVAECCRNLSTVGALPIATTNNLNFGNPERPEIMAQIVESIEGLAEACRFFRCASDWRQCQFV